MKSANNSDITYQVFALMISIIIVHSIYVISIRPNAEAIMTQQIEQQQSNPDHVVQRSWFVVLKDFEQETCFILMLWAMAIMAQKAKFSNRENQLLKLPLLKVRSGHSILPEDTETFAQPLYDLPIEERDRLIPRSLLAALQRFRTSHNIAAASAAVRENCEMESDRLDSELSMVRYIAWAIPSIGFIGTVRGIGDALGQAHRAIAGDIAGVTANLGVAFNSTFVALMISIVVMFLSHQLQLLQERQVLDAQKYCDEKLIRHLSVE